MENLSSSIRSQPSVLSPQSSVLSPHPFGHSHSPWSSILGRFPGALQYSNTVMPRTLFEKIWDSHVVHQEPGKPAILYIDCHLVHEVTSPQAFEGLRITGRKVRRPDLTFATMDHNVPTTSRSLPIADLISKTQIDTLEHN